MNVAEYSSNMGLAGNNHRLHRGLIGGIGVG